MPPSGLGSIDLTTRLVGPVIHTGSNFSNGILSLPLEIAPA
jgi:hypothetical protein